MNEVAILGTQIPATVKDLTNPGHANVEAWVSDHCLDSGLLLFCAHREFRPGTLLSVVLNDSMLLGEVYRCNPLHDGRFLAHMHVEHSLANLSLLREILHECEWEPPISRTLRHAS